MTPDKDLTQHEGDCDKHQVYTDGAHRTCLCKARLLNTYAGASLVHQDRKTRPAKVITLVMKTDEELRNE